MGALLRLVSSSSAEVQPPADVDLMESWAEYLAAYGCSPRTIALRVGSIRSLMKQVQVDSPLELTRDHVIAWLGGGIKQWTRVTYYASAKAFTRWLREFEHDPNSDLVKGIPAPKSPEPVARPITDAVVDRMLTLKLPPRPHAYVRLALFEALRIHEIAKLRGEDFDFAAGWLMVTGKGGVTKPIPIHDEIAKLAASMPEVGWWFPSPGNPDQPVQGGAVGETIRNVLRRCGSPATAHQLRDTAATRMQRQVKDIRLTQSMLRHRNIRSTMKYTEAANDDLQRAVGSLDWVDVAQAVPEANAPSEESAS